MRNKGKTTRMLHLLNHMASYRDNPPVDGGGNAMQSFASCRVLHRGLPPETAYAQFGRCDAWVCSDANLSGSHTRTAGTDQPCPSRLRDFVPSSVCMMIAQNSAENETKVQRRGALRSVQPPHPARSGRGGGGFRAYPFEKGLGDSEQPYNRQCVTFSTIQ
jgi:hypothetical protein